MKPSQPNAEHLLAAIVASSSDAIISKTLEGIVSSWNDSAERLLGFTAAEMIGQSIRIIIPKDRQAEEDKILAKIRSGQTVKSFETIRTTKSGRALNVSITASPIHDASGQIVGASKILRDITQLTALLKEASERERRFQGIFNSSFQYTGLIATDGTMLEINKTALDAIGTRSEDVIGKQFWLTPWWSHHPEEQTRIKEAIKRAALGEFIRFEAKYRPSGEYEAIIDLSISPIRDEAGDVVLLIPEGRDITERKRAERELLESRKRQDQILDNTLAFMSLLDQDGRIVEVNARARAAAGQKSEKLIGRSFADAPWWKHSPETRADITQIVRECLKGDTIRKDLRIHLPDGEIRWIDFQSTPLMNSDGEIIGAVPSAVDISDRKRAEENNDLLLHEVNHRAKNILAVVGAILRQTSATTPEEFKERFGARLGALAANQDLLVNGNWRDVTLRQLLASQLSHFAGAPEAKIAMHGADLRIKSEAAQALSMAFFELATNAVKYGALSTSKGHVDVAWACTEKNFSISWTERGGPEILTNPTRRGFGSKVIEQMTKVSLKADVTLAFEKEGVRWALECPNERAVAT